MQVLRGPGIFKVSNRNRTVPSMLAKDTSKPCNFRGKEKNVKHLKKTRNIKQKKRKTKKKQLKHLVAQLPPKKSYGSKRCHPWEPEVAGSICPFTNVGFF